MKSPRIAGRIVCPGEELDPSVEAEHPYVVEFGGRKIATVVGLYTEREGRKAFIKLKGLYIPRPGDVVIGLVVGQGVMNWYLDINSPYTATLMVQDFLGRQYNPAVDEMSRLLSVGDYVKARVAAFDKTRNPALTVQGEGLGRIVSGSVVEVSPAKVPRIIGKKKSMVSLIEEKTGCKLFVAVNGRVHVECGSEDMEPLVAYTIKLIEREAHTSGLTARVTRFLEEELRIRGK